MSAGERTKAPKLPAQRDLAAMGDRELLGEVDRQADFLDPGHIRRVTDERGVLSPADRRPYVTRRPHGDIPVGTPCFVSRPGDGRALRLEFQDRIIETQGYAAGIEWKLERVTAEWSERNPDG